jgi:hypothetical protein
MKQKTRYRVTVGDSQEYRDTPPDEAWYARAEAFSMNRGVTIQVHECTTIINPSAPTGEKVRLSDRLLWELEA